MKVVNKEMMDELEEEDWRFTPSVTKVYHDMPARPVKKCHVHRKNSVPETRTGPRTANPLCTGDAH